MLRPVSFASLAEPAIAARWRAPGAAVALAARWRERPVLRMEEVLVPGLAAELADWVPRMPVAPAASHSAVWWGCDAEVPARPAPRLPDCFVQLARCFDVDLPALVSAITGRSLAPARRGHFTVRVWRKGSFADDLAELEGDDVGDGVAAVIGLTAGGWPDDWGGVHQALGQRLPPGWNTLDLIGAGVAQQVTLVTRHVTVVTLHAALVEAT